MPKKTSDEDKPKRLSTYAIKLTGEQMDKLRAVIDAKGWAPFDVAYARFAFRGPDCNVTAYESGKLVVAGKGTEDFVLHTLEAEVTQAAKLGYDAVLHPDWFESHAGLDESGKGDFFGPVIAATVIADPQAIDAWIKAGVKDSKKIADPQILKLEKIIRGTAGVTVRTCFCGMTKYNELMARPHANLNRLLAWQHATALSQGLAVRKVPWGLLDQFTKQPLVQRELVKMGVKEFDLRMRTHAEEDPVVAASSVIARAEFLGRGQMRSTRSSKALWRQAPERSGPPGKGTGGGDHPEVRGSRARRFCEAAFPHGL